MVVLNEMEIEIIHPKVIERRDNPFKFIRNDAAKHIVDQLEKFKKKIPKKGLNNMTKPRTYKFRQWMYNLNDNGYDVVTHQYPTLIKRMNDLRWHVPFLPPQMVAAGISAEDFDEKRVKKLLIECFELLDNLYVNLDSVTVVDKEQIEQYKMLVRGKRMYLMTTAKMLGMIQEVEFSLFEAKGEK